MIMQRIIRWSRSAVMLGGVLFGLNVAGNALTDYTRIHSEIHALGAISVLPLLIALVGLYSQYTDRYALPGRLVFLFTFCSLLAWAIGSFAVGLFAAALDMDNLAEIGFTTTSLGLQGVGIGSALLGIVLWRSGIISRFGAVLLILGATLIFIFARTPVTAFLPYGPPDTYSYLVALALVGPFSLAWVWLGYTLRSSSTRSLLAA